jgi:hypothetical protein
VEQFRTREALIDSSLAVLIGLAATITLVLGFVVAAALRPGKPGRHKGSYIPAKDRPIISGATNHNAAWEGVGSRSRRFPELERPMPKAARELRVPRNLQQTKPEG